MTTKDVLTLFLAGASLLVTIVWNLSNRRYTNKVAGRLRSESFRFDEWKDHRSEILRALRDMEGSVSRLMVLSRGAHDKEALLKEIHREATALIQHQLTLVRELERASLDPDWRPFAYGRMAADESDWDRLNTVLAEIDQLDNADAIRSRLPELGPFIGSLAQCVNFEVIRVRNAELAPPEVD